MEYAIDKGERRIKAEPGLQGYCPICGSGVLARCGSINVWHWAHKNRKDCDPWSEPETEWHLAWKRFVIPEKVEVVIKPHRADIVGMKGVVIELQHSPISADEITERECFYKKMVWVIDAASFAHNFVLKRKGNRETFRWKWPKRSWAAATCPLFLDFGNDKLFEIEKLYPSSPEKLVETFASDGTRLCIHFESRRPCAGVGHTLPKDNFLLRYLRDRLRG